MKYRVSTPYCVWVHAVIEADDEDAASEEAAGDEYRPEELVGRRSIGIGDSRATVEVCDDPLDEPPNMTITIAEVEE